MANDPKEILKSKMRNKISSTPKSTSSNGTNLSLLAQFDDMFRMVQPTLITKNELKCKFKLFNSNKMDHHFLFYLFVCLFHHSIHWFS